jgi:hypothetical protein
MKLMAVRLCLISSFHDAQLRIVDGPQDQTRNLEIPGSLLRSAPE